MEGLDYAWSKPNLDVAWNMGKRFVCRYLAYDGTNGYDKNSKVLRPSERAALHARGFGIVLNWEQAAGDLMKGYALGVTHAKEALRLANALGAPSWVPIYFSCDTDTNSSQRAAVAAYLDGAASVLGRNRVGVYGEYEVIEALVPTHAAWGWQTYAWSGGKNSDKAHVKQYKNGVNVAGADCDLNVSLKSNFGAWFPGDAQPESTEADEMNLGDIVHLPADYKPYEGAADTATVETILGYVNGRVIRLESMLTALAAKPAATVTVDSAALAAALLEPAFLAALAKAVNDDSYRRMAE